MTFRLSNSQRSSSALLVRVSLPSKGGHLLLPCCNTKYAWKARLVQFGTSLITLLTDPLRLCPCVFLTEYNLTTIYYYIMALFGADAAHSVHFKPVPAFLLRFPPESLPSTLSSPPGGSTLAHPFTIPHNIYNTLLSVRIPITVAVTYVTIATILNRYNEKRNQRPWPISKTRAFRVFVITHNVLLALYSAWTFAGLLNAVRVSLEGAAAEHGLVGVVDALCKINGPRGLGDAATFNATTHTWGFTNRAMKLAAGDLPDTTDIGRIWNEGLAFYGWLFYLSKFYQVFDTLIILAMGKKTSLLQTYHHAGAMMCMWAGIRYMAPPIWMFVMVNSSIHTLMVS